MPPEQDDVSEEILKVIHPFSFLHFLVFVDLFTDSFSPQRLRETQRLYAASLERIENLEAENAQLKDKYKASCAEVETLPPQLLLSLYI